MVAHGNLETHNRTQQVDAGIDNVQAYRYGTHFPCQQHGGRRCSGHVASRSGKGGKFAVNEAQKNVSDSQNLFLDRNESFSILPDGRVNVGICINVVGAREKVIEVDDILGNRGCTFSILQVIHARYIGIGLVNYAGNFMAAVFKNHEDIVELEPVGKVFGIGLSLKTDGTSGVQP